MRIAACITTRNRTQNLEQCLRALWQSTVRPALVIVSDDSSTSETQEQNRQIVEQYPNFAYILGPQAGVCANRNNAVNATSLDNTDFVTFIDDDVYVDSDFYERAIAHYSLLPAHERAKAILTGVSYTREGYETRPSKLSFRGYFCLDDKPQTVAIHATFFPRKFFDVEQWDEHIFFGYEDAELSLRAIKHGYSILYCPELRALHAGSGNQTTLNIKEGSNLTKYEIYVEAARLYVGIKRYKNLFPNPFKLFSFLVIYTVHMTIYLIRHNSLRTWIDIVRFSNAQKLWRTG